MSDCGDCFFYPGNVEDRRKPTMSPARPEISQNLLSVNQNFSLWLVPRTISLAMIAFVTTRSFSARNYGFVHRV